MEQSQKGPRFKHSAVPLVLPLRGTLAVAAALDPSLAGTERLRLEVRTDPLRRGQVREGSGALVEVAVGVDVDRFKERVLSTLERV